MEKDLFLAFERGEFEVYYQPQVNLINNTISGMEALLRWHHPQKGMILPSLFIPVAEHSGLIYPLSKWVLRIACLQALAWKTIGLTPVRVAVNISACQFIQPQFASEVTQILQETGLDPTQLELELTESMLINNTEDIISVMQELKDIGVGLSLDDFGTGYSSLSHLARLPIDSLKIDQSFISAIGKLPTNGSICTIIMALAGSLGLRTIAEGVETQEQLKFMIAHNCDEMQGYFFSHPLPADQCTRLLTAVNTLNSNTPARQPMPNSRLEQRIEGRL